MATKAVKSEIKAMGNSSLVSALKDDAWDAYLLRLAIKKFVDGSKRELTGPNYDTARNYASQYISILDKRIETALELAEAIKSGCDSLASYMGKYAVLDEAERVNYESKLKDAQNKLNALSSYDWDAEGFGFFNYWETYFSSKLLIKECTEYLEKLNGLSAADATAYAPIAEASATKFSV